MGGVNRYPGPKPFKQEEAAQYHGRAHDIEQLYNHVLLNNCTVLLGKSGVGKTSLINAGLLPKIESEINLSTHDNRLFRAVPIILTAYNPDDTFTLVQKVHATIKVVLGSIDEVSEKFLQFLPEHLRQSINFCLKQYQLQGFLQQRKEFFLLIFDQLEQLFSYPLEQVEALEQELREIVNPNLPDEMRIQLQEARGRTKQLLERHEIAMLEQPVNVKFLFAIRSDRLSLLIRLRLAIPDILLNPYEVKPLTKLQATKAIVAPAAAIGNQFKSAPFAYKDSVVQHICQFIEALPNSDIEFKFYDGKIEPIILQIICRYIEEQVAPNDNDGVISDEEIDLNVILENYYESSIQSLNLSANELQQVLVLLEEKLIYGIEKRRLTLYESIIKFSYKVSKKILDQLTELGLLRCIATVGFESAYEIAHDWLVLPLLEARQRRILKSSLVEDVYLNLLQEKINNSNGDAELLKQRAAYYATLGQNKEAISDYTTVLSLLPTKSYDVLLSRAIAYTAEGRLAEAEKDIITVLKEAPQLNDALYRMGIIRYLQKNYAAAINLFDSFLLQVPNHANALNYLGIISLNEQRSEASLKYFERAVAIDPHHQVAIYNIGVLYYQAANEVEAKKYFELALEVPPGMRTSVDDSNCWNYLGMIAADANGNLNDGLECFKKAVEIWPANGHAQFNLGTIYLDNKNYADALNCFEQVNEKNANYSRSRNFMGSIYTAQAFEGFNLEKAYECFLIAYQLEPKSTNYAYNLGWVAYIAQQYTLSQEWFEKVIKLDPVSTDAMNYLGLIAEKLDDRESAKKRYSFGLTVDASHQGMRYNLGRMYYEEGNLDAAKECMTAVLSINANSSDALNYMGLIQKRLGNNADALKWFQQSLEADQYNHYPCYNMGVLYFDDNDYQNAIASFKQTISIDPKNVFSYNYLGLIAENSSDIDLAIFNYQKATEIQDNYAVGHYNLGIAYYKGAKYDESATAFTRALKLKHQQGTCCNYLGAICFIKNDLNAAIDYYQQALQHMPNNEYALFNIGESFFQKDDFTSASNYWQQLLQLQPDDWETIWSLARCAVRLQQPQQAQAYFETLQHIEKVPAEKLELLKQEMAAMQ